MQTIDLVRIADIAAVLAIQVRFATFLAHYRRLRPRKVAVAYFTDVLWEESWMMWKGVFAVFLLIGCGFVYSLVKGFPPSPVTVFLLPALVYAGVGIHRFARACEEALGSVGD